MAQGNYGTSSNPLSELFAEQIVLTPRTSDPSSPSQGDMWLRTDLASGDKIATVRWQNASGTQDIPVFATSESTDSEIKKVLRIQTPNGLGFIPVYEGGGAYSELGLQHGGARHGVHNSLSAIPDSGISRWTFDDVDTSGGQAIDVWGDNDGSINGATTSVSGANQTYNTAEAYSFDAVDDNVNFGSPTPLNNLWAGGGSLAIWFNHNGSGQYMMSKADGTNGWILYTIDSDGSVQLLKYWDSGYSWRTAAGSYSTSSWTHLIITYNSDSTNNEPTFYINGSSVSLQSSENPSGSNGDDSTISMLTAEYNGAFWGGSQDDPRTWDKELSSSEANNVYNTGSI